MKLESLATAETQEILGTAAAETLQIVGTAAPMETLQIVGTAALVETAASGILAGIVAAPVETLQIVGTAAPVQTLQIVGTAAPAETAANGTMAALVATGVMAIGGPAMAALSAMGGAINARGMGVAQVAVPGSKISVGGNKMAAMVLVVPMVAITGVAATMAGMDALRIFISHRLTNQGIREEHGKSGQIGLPLLAVTSGARTSFMKPTALWSG